MIVNGSKTLNSRPTHNLSGMTMDKLTLYESEEDADARTKMTMKKPKIKDVPKRVKAASPIPNKLITSDVYKMTCVHRIQNVKGQWVACYHCANKCGAKSVVITAALDDGESHIRVDKSHSCDLPQSQLKNSCNWWMSRRRCWRPPEISP